MILIRWVFALLVIGALVFFGARNQEVVKVDYFFGGIRLPMFLWMFGFIAAGALMSLVVSLVDHLRLRSGIRRLRKRTEELEGQIASLKLQPRPSGSAPEEDEDAQE